jgi:hypothetical protein
VVQQVLLAGIAAAGSHDGDPAFQPPVPSVLRLIDLPALAGAKGIVRPPCPHCRRVIPLCPHCLVTDPANQETRAGCGRRGPVSVRTPGGPREAHHVCCPSSGQL